MTRWLAADHAEPRPPVGARERPRVVRVALLGVLLALASYTTFALLRADWGDRRSLVEDLAVVVTPIALGALMWLLLMLQERRTARARAGWAESEERFRLAVEAARCGIWEWDLATGQVFLSDVTAVMLGWGGGGVASAKDVLARIAPEHRARVESALLAAGVDGALDVSFRVPDPRTGRAAWIDARGQARGTPGPTGYTRLIGVALDVTREQTSTRRAQLAEARLRDAVESASEAFVLWDSRGQLVMCNSRYREFFNLEPHVLKPGAAHGAVDSIAKLAIIREQTPPDSPRGVREIELADGRWLHLTQRRTTDRGLVVVGADITAVKRQEENRRRNEEALQALVAQLKASQTELSELALKYQDEKARAESASKAKTDFLANMSHELRTPLNAVNGFSEIMVGELYGPMGDKRYKEYAQDILSSGQHLLALINDILDMSKIEAGKLTLRLEQIHLEDALDDVVRLMRERVEAAKLDLQVSVPPRLPEIEADYRAVKQVLLNLLSNAVKFTPKGGKVTVTVRAEARSVRILVRDTGVGIAAEDLARLARPFEQVESQNAKTHQGTGLGLALSRSLVSLHGGSLDMRSEPGVGTAVVVTLPIQQGAPQLEEPVLASAAAA